jgi:hypothetical protein
LYLTAGGGVVNASGDVVFLGYLGSNLQNARAAVLIWHDGTTRAVACPGQAMPGGGNLVAGPCCVAQYGINQRGWVAYPASLDEDTDGNGQIDSGMYVERRGQTSLVARIGTVLPGIGTVLDIGEPGSRPGPAIPPGNSGGLINRSGQVVLVVTLSDGREAIVRATPVKAYPSSAPSRVARAQACHSSIVQPPSSTRER